jgi:C2H2 type zinc finger protein
MNLKLLPNGPIIIIFSLITSIGQLSHAMKKRPLEDLTQLESQAVPEMIALTEDNSNVSEKDQEDVSAKKQRVNTNPLLQQYQCVHCPDTFFHSKKARKTHVKAFHSDLTCPYCPMAYVRRLNLENHIAKKHADKLSINQITTPNPSLSNKPSKISDIQMREPQTILESPTQGLNEILKNIEIPATPGDNQELSNLSSPPNSLLNAYIDIAKQIALTSAANQSKNIPCGYCDQMFTRSKKRTAHILVSHPGENPLACYFCYHTFGQPSALEKHIIDVHEINKRCCNQSFETNEDLQNHFAKVHAEKPSYSDNALSNNNNALSNFVSACAINYEIISAISTNPINPIATEEPNSSMTNQAHRTVSLLHCPKCNNNNHLFDEVSLDLHIQEMHTEES